MRKTWVQSLGWEDPLEKEMATHSSILAWRIPWMEELGGLQSMGHKESDTTERLHFHYCAHLCRKCSLDVSNFLDEISSLSHSCFPVSLHCSLKKAFLSLLPVLWNSAFRWIYLSFSPFPFTSLLFSAICEASSDNHFTFCISFSWRWF